jgi:putative DNA primase/helicase
MFMPHGGGANLKSTCLMAPRFALGDYACEAPSDLLIARREWNAGSESALAGLRGPRLVTTTETERSKKLAEVLAKKLTGEPEITAKFMRQDYFTYRNQTAIWLATNYKPIVQGTDHAIWRRIKLIPFEVTIPERDWLEMGEVERRLRAEVNGILAWLVEGLRMYQEEGLVPEPEAIRTATEAYKEEMDPLADFIDEHFVEDPDGVVPIQSVREMYEDYMRGRPGGLGHRQFNVLMEERGFERPKNPVRIGSAGPMKVWKGLKVRC